jgi:hypothetical protein
MLFSDKVFGWSKKTWWQKVKSNGPTLTLIRSKIGKVSGGFTEAAWDNTGLVSDPNTFLFSLTQRKKYSPIDIDSGLYMVENDGPNFGLGVLHVAEGDNLNGEGKSSCLTQTDGYRIQMDEQGRS